MAIRVPSARRTQTTGVPDEQRCSAPLVEVTRPGQRHTTGTTSGTTFSPAFRRRFWAKVRDAGDCWEWTGATAAGYGRVKVKGRLDGAHRIAVMLSGREIPEGHVVCHACDNRACVRPAHLFVGTYSDNMRDAVAKGRVDNSDRRPPPPLHGEDNPSAQLTEADVWDILGAAADGEPRRQIADRYPVSYDQIGRIIRGEKWVGVYERFHRRAAA